MLAHVVDLDCIFRERRGVVGDGHTMNEYNIRFERRKVWAGNLQSRIKSKLTSGAGQGECPAWLRERARGDSMILLVELERHCIARLGSDV